MSLRRLFHHRALSGLYPRPLAPESKDDGESAPKSFAQQKWTNSAAMLLLLLAAPLAHPQELRRIMYGTSASPSHLPIWVAKDAGLFDRPAHFAPTDDLRNIVETASQLLFWTSTTSGKAGNQGDCAKGREDSEHNRLIRDLG